ncbi:MAG TPA: indole-3-glycerol-phosphate synthase TrpC, partial [Terriglobales bacterium]|nr:indole-3-glycerol-phosphate synthase TrpC [Terriglobales bacterium]
ELIGINNRDLRTFETTLATTESLMPRLSSLATVVSESGIDSRADIERLQRAGVHCFLIGESLMRAPDPGVRLSQLLATAAS